MAFIWMDVSTILSWHRPAVGVVRVEQECAEKALGDSNFKFCRADGQGGFYEVSREEVSERVFQEYGGNTKNGNSIDAVSNESIAVGSKWKVLYHKLNRFVPSIFSRHFEGFVRKNKGDLVNILNSIAVMKTSLRAVFLKNRQSTKGRSKSSDLEKELLENNLPKAPFRDSDVYLSVGADWNHSDLSNIFKLKKTKSIKVVLFCYDLIPVKLPHLTLDYVAKIFPVYYANMAWAADHIICISESSKQDMLEYFESINAPAPNVSTVRLGCDVKANKDFSLQGSDSVLTKIGRSKYILYVSTIERRKNHEALYKAYLDILSEPDHGDVPLLVFVGMRGWGVDGLLKDIEKDPRVKNKILILEDVGDLELAWLYRNSLFSLYPSLYEGWGLPIAESLAYGRLCIASNSSSMPEVAGELVDYVHPHDVKGWSEKIKFYLDNPDELQLKEGLIRDKFKPDEWERASSYIINVCRSL